MRRAYASGINIRSLMPVLFWFSSAVPVENLHPLQWGIFRIKYRHDRRSGLPLESPLLFYGRYAADIARKVVIVARRWRHLKRIVRKVEADPHAKLYMDDALTPVAEEDSAHMELYTQNEAARSPSSASFAWRERAPTAMTTSPPAMSIGLTITMPGIPLPGVLSTTTSPFRLWCERPVDGRNEG